MSELVTENPNDELLTKTENPKNDETMKLLQEKGELVYDYLKKVD